ncbi:piggyBac transposable element-derived protein 4-like isoform X2 [Penaeus japonicus]|uniref:piggyBac transposable element-derived protein 4-like isoform X2 n=1 Tax=Penaeus japonicus TaxID=27405 RepID=UPI001C716711|nr:piggyBac transposable element-derived protein 4-like isoform X2 [Penaeus japonicus]
MAEAVFIKEEVKEDFLPKRRSENKAKQGYNKKRRTDIKEEEDVDIKEENEIETSENEDCIDINEPSYILGLSDSNEHKQAVLDVTEKTPAAGPSAGHRSSHHLASEASGPGRSCLHRYFPDSDWDDDVGSSSSSDDDSDSEWDELGYISSESSNDSDTPLSQVVLRCSQRNAPGTPGFVWKRKQNVPQRYRFAASPGIKLNHLERTSTPRTLFDCFLTPELMQIITNETNRFAGQQERSTSSHMKEWKDASVDEMYVYLGLRIMMDVQPRPRQRHFWSRDPKVRCCLFPKTMTRDRFDSLSRYFHFSDNNDPRAAEDQLWKLRPVIDAISRQFSSVFIPSKLVTVDESLWAFRRHHHAMQYNPSKRASHGMKVYQLCASDGPEAGYTCAFRIYIGQDRSDFPVSMKVVVDLMEAADMLGKGYEVHLDNWYTSPALFHYLQTQSTSAVGTVRPNRKFMPRDMEVKVRGDVDYRSTRTGMLCLSWMDKRVVTMLSTVHTSEMVTLPTRQQGVTRSKPRVVMDYNVGMNGVDLSDQLPQYYPTTRRSIKWYRKIFFNLLDMCIVNAYRLHKLLGGNMPQYNFRLELVDSLLGLHSNGTVSRTARELDHLPDFTPHQRYRRCRMCWRAGLRRDTRIMCIACKVALCAGRCFRRFHTQ